MVQITALMDNKLSENKALTAEHGLSYLVEKENFRLLFDCSAGAAFLSNAHRLGKNLGSLDAVVLSHSHYDHAAGYRDLVENSCECRVLYTGDHFFEPKYAFDGTKYTDLSCGFDRDFLEKYEIEHRAVNSATEIASGIWLIGGFPRTHSFEKIPDRFVKLLPEKMKEGVEAAVVPDPFDDEICMAIEAEDGLTVLVGCSHPGILNMLEGVRNTLNKPICRVYGGTHLIEADPDRIRTTVEELKRMGLHVLGLGHCSGELAENIICEDKEVSSCHMGVGDTIFIH